jgi:hypothetical protein
MVNIRFRTPIEPDSLLAVAPPPSESETGSMTWQWAGEVNLTNVGLAMMVPSWWDAFLAERAAAASPRATLADDVALAGRYRHLAQLPVLPFQNDDFTDRFYPSAVSTLEAAVADPLRPIRRVRRPCSLRWHPYDERAEKSDGGAPALHTASADAAIRDAGGHANPR